MIYNIKYRPLKAFLLATETGSFTQAAELLGVTQPSFTALIRDLEKTLGFKVFERTTRRITLTSEGIDLCDQIRAPLADIEAAYRNMMDLALARRGSIVLGALPSTALTLIPPTLGALRAGHPDLKIRVIEAHNDTLIAMLRASQVEFVLATLFTDAPDLKFLPLVQDVFCAVYPPDHPVASLPALYWRDLVAHDLVLLSRGSSARNQFEGAIRDEAVAPGLRFDVTHMTTAALLARQGLGVALLPRLALPALPLDGLQFRPIQDASATRSIGLIQHHKHILSPAGRAFVGQLRAFAAQLEKANT